MKKRTKNWINGGLALVAGVALVGCGTAGSFGDSSATRSALLGSAAGAGLGAIIGHQSGETGEGAAIGAGVGAVGGYLIGNEQDKSQQRQRTQVAQAQADAAYTAAQTVVINVNNSNGSMTPVTLRREGNVYVGPKEERYNHMPTEEQLRSVYGF
jgi:hypothetical protein